MTEVPIGTRVMAVKSGRHGSIVGLLAATHTLGCYRVLLDGETVRQVMVEECPGQIGRPMFRRLNPLELLAEI